MNMCYNNKMMNRLLIMLVAVAGLASACRGGAAAEGDSISPEPSATAAKVYHFKDLRTPYSLQAIYIKYHPDEASDSLWHGDSRFAMYGSKELCLKHAFEYLTLKGVHYDIVDTGTVFTVRDLGFMLPTREGGDFVFVQTDSTGDFVYVFGAEPHDIGGNMTIGDDGDVDFASSPLYDFVPVDLPVDTAQ